MSRSLFNLRRAFFGALCTGCMVFGSAQAFATPQARVGIGVACNPYSGGDHDLEFCSAACYEAGYTYGSCTLSGYCDCRRLRPAG